MIPEIHGGMLFFRICVSVITMMAVFWVYCYGDQAEKIKRDSNLLYDTEKDTVQDKCTLEDQAEVIKPA